MIRKTSETRPLSATVVNEYNDSQVNAYSTEYVNDILEWKYLGTTTGQNNYINLPTNWNELNVIIVINNQLNFNSLVYISKNMLDYVSADSNGVKQFNATCMALSGSSSGATVLATSINIKNDNQICNGYTPGYSASTKIYVFYR